MDVPGLQVQEQVAEAAKVSAQEQIVEDAEIIP